MKQKKNIFLVIMLLAIAAVLAACNSDDGKEAEAPADTGGGSGVTETSGPAEGADSDWKPTKPIEFIAPAGAGGGWDTTARASSKVLEEEKLVDQRFAVVNKPGGGGAIGWAYIDSKNTDDHLLFTTSPPIMFVPLNNQSDLGHQDFTPIAALTADYGAFLVKADSPFNTMNDLVEAMKADPTAISIVGASAPGSMDHMQFVKAVHAAGVDAKTVKYVSSQDGAGMTMLLGGQVDVYSTDVGEAVEQYRAGNVKVLAVTAEERMDGEVVSEFPTLIEQGIDDSFVVWRGVMGPKNMSKEAAAFYENALKEMSETEAWKVELDRYGWVPNWMGSEEFSAFLDEQYEAIRSLMEDMGLR